MAVTWTEDNAAQEWVNAWTHGLGLLASLPAGLALAAISITYQAALLYACVIYSVSLSGMYLFSTLSHAIRQQPWRHLARAWDQAAVYGLIAGTFTPFIWAYTHSWQRAGLLLLVWGAAALGGYSKLIVGHRLNNMTSITYVLLGWIPAMFLWPQVSKLCFAMMALGGVLYTLGTWFLHNDHRHQHFHAVWHLLVIMASACHYAAIIMFPVLNLDR